LLNGLFDGRDKNRESRGDYLSRDGQSLFQKEKESKNGETTQKAAPVRKTNQILRQPRTESGAQAQTAGQSFAPASFSETACEADQRGAAARGSSQTETHFPSAALGAFEGYRSCTGQEEKPR